MTFPIGNEINLLPIPFYGILNIQTGIAYIHIAIYTITC
jgi:hypothetical protein